MSGISLKELERDNRIELSPPPWQGGVLPLYESRKTKDLDRHEFITWQRKAHKALQRTRPCKLLLVVISPPRRGYVVSIHFHDAGSFHNGRLLLPLGKALGPFPINVYPGKFLAVVIVNGDLPVLMLAPAVAMKPAGFTALFLFHRAHPPRDRKLWQFYKPRTSTELRVNFFNIIGRGER